MSSAGESRAGVRRPLCFVSDVYDIAPYCVGHQLQFADAVIHGVSLLSVMQYDVVCLCLNNTGSPAAFQEGMFHK